jgi:hypothetical protein
LTDRAIGHSEIVTKGIAGQGNGDIVKEGRIVILEVEGEMTLAVTSREMCSASVFSQ